MDSPTTRSDFLRAVDSTLSELYEITGHPTANTGNGDPLMPFLAACQKLRGSGKEEPGTQIDNDDSLLLLMGAIHGYTFDRDTFTPAQFVETLQNWKKTADTCGAQPISTLCQTAITTASGRLFAHLNNAH